MKETKIVITLSSSYGNLRKSSQKYNGVQYVETENEYTIEDLLDEIDNLFNETEELKSEIDELNERIKELEENQNGTSN